MTAWFGAVDQPRLRTTCTSLEIACASVRVCDVHAGRGALKTFLTKSPGPNASHIFPCALACKASRDTAKIDLIHESMYNVQWIHRPARRSISRPEMGKAHE